MADIDDTLAARVRQLREAQRLSQERLSVQAGLHERYVGQLERRERGATVRAAEKLARALGVTIADLVGEAAAGGAPSPALARLLAVLRGRREAELATIARVFDVIFGPERPGRSKRR